MGSAVSCLRSRVGNGKPIHVGPRDPGHDVKVGGVYEAKDADAGDAVNSGDIVQMDGDGGVSGVPGNVDYHAKVKRRTRLCTMSSHEDLNMISRWSALHTTGKPFLGTQSPSPMRIMRPPGYCRPGGSDVVLSSLQAGASRPGRFSQSSVQIRPPTPFPQCPYNGIASFQPHLIPERTWREPSLPFCGRINSQFAKITPSNEDETRPQLSILQSIRHCPL